MAGYSSHIYFLPQSGPKRNGRSEYQGWLQRVVLHDLRDGSIVPASAVSPGLKLNQTGHAFDLSTEAEAGGP
jgi:hypothetical protein